MSHAQPTPAPAVRHMIVNGSLLRFEDATVHLMSPAMRYGLNVFEGLRAYWNARGRESSMSFAWPSTWIAWPNR